MYQFRNIFVAKERSAWVLSNKRRYKDSEKYSRRSRSNSIEDYSPKDKKQKYYEEKVYKKERTWVMPQLKVRCIDSKMRNGKYYKTKVGELFYALYF